MEYSGHEATILRQQHFLDSSEKRAESYKEAVKSRIGAAEITNVVAANFNDLEKPIVVEYDVKIANYAQKTGKRLLLQPVFFEYGVKPVFTSATRTNSVYFSYPWAEDDKIEIQLPDNFERESIVPPAPIDDPQGVGSLHVSLFTQNEQNLLKVDRQFHFGGGGNVIFPIKFYPAIKTMFDSFNRADSTVIMLKQR